MKVKKIHVLIKIKMSTKIKKVYMFLIKSSKTKTIRINIKENNKLMV